MRNNNLVRRNLQLFRPTPTEERAGAIAWGIIIALVVGVILWQVRG